MQAGGNMEKLSTASGSGSQQQLKAKFQVQFSYNFHTNKPTVRWGPRPGVFFPLFQKGNIVLH